MLKILINIFLKLTYAVNLFIEEKIIDKSKELFNDVVKSIIL
jgi:hypothetical protein